MLSSHKGVYNEDRQVEIRYLVKKSLENNGFRGVKSYKNLLKFN